MDPFANSCGQADRGKTYFSTIDKIQAQKLLVSAPFFCSHVETDRAVEVVQRQPSAAAAPPLPAAAAKAKTTIKNTVRAATRQSGRVGRFGGRHDVLRML